MGIRWTASDLRQAKREQRFTTLETQAPTGTVALELDGAAYHVSAGGFVAAGLHLPLVETGRIADFRHFNAAFDGRE